MSMPDVDFQQFGWQPTDRYWSDVVYVQTVRQNVVPAPTGYRRSRSGPVRIVRHANICDGCRTQRAQSGACLCD